MGEKMKSEAVYQILDYFDFGKNQEITELAQEFRAIGLDIRQLDKIIIKLNKNLKEKNADLFYEKSPFYHLLIACAAYLAGHKEAISCAERAESQFRNQGKTLDQSLTNWLLGLFLYEGDHVDQALERIDDAINCLASIIKERTNNGRYADCDSCQEIIKEIQTFRKGISDSLIASHNFNKKTQDGKTASQQSQVGQDGYLFLPQLPTYHHVQAGSGGPIWVSASPGAACTEMDHCVIGDRKYSIFSVKRGNRRINLDPGKQYGWAPVEGNSMNMAKPTPINAGNMALFYQSSEAADNAFVIVSCPVDQGAGYSFMVKRWNSANQQFLSDSSESDHPPISCNKDCRIIGIVTGVAKPS
jgi:tetratricopeptide (TPR) repeat protein